MRVLPLVLVLAFGAAQAVEFTDCGCGPVCGHARHALPGESGGCCGSPEAPEEGGCVHLAPASDLLAGPAALELSAPAGAVVATPGPAAPPPAAPLEDAAVPARPARGRPLFVLHSSFLI